MSFIGSITGVDQLKKAAREWAAKVVNLHKSDVPQNMQKDKEGLLAYAKTVKNLIEKVFPNFDLIENGDSNQLGWIPIIAGAAIAAAAAAIAKWTYDYNKFMARLKEYNKLRAEGVSGQDAAKILSTLEPPSVSSSIGKIAVYIPWAIAGLMLYSLNKAR